jgi:hypothetical protein
MKAGFQVSMSTKDATEDRIDRFIEESERHFRFLVDQHAFSGPRADIDRRAHQVTVTYFKKQVGIVVVYDFREDDLLAEIVRGEEGRIPRGFSVDSAGRRIRLTLGDFLSNRGVRDRGLRGPRNEAWDARLNRLLSRYAALLQSYGGDVLTGSSEALDEPRVKRER